MPVEKQELDKSIKAVRSFKELLDNGPLMTILSLQTIAIAVLLYLYIESESGKRDIQAELYREMIQRTDKIIETRVTEQMDPIINNVQESVIRLNETRRTIDTASQKIKNLIKDDNK